MFTTDEQISENARAAVERYLAKSAAKGERETHASIARRWNGYLGNEFSKSWVTLYKLLNGLMGWRVHLVQALAFTLECSFDELVAVKPKTRKVEHEQREFDFRVLWVRLAGRELDADQVEQLSENLRAEFKKPRVFELMRRISSAVTSARTLRQARDEVDELLRESGIWRDGRR